MATIKKSPAKKAKIESSRKKSSAKPVKLRRYARRRSPRGGRHYTSQCGAEAIGMLGIGIMFGIITAVVLIKGEPVQQNQGLRTQSLPGRHYRPQRHDVILA